MRLKLIVCVFLVVATISVFWQVKNHDFVNYDDSSYVTENRHVQGGLTWDGVQWAFTTFHSSNWHPLTWLSHMLDCQLYGLNAGGHHLTSLLFHVVNTLLLFFILNRMTGALWRSAFVAALFALHPLHVESVAWVAERKDVLSTFFWMLTMWAYIRYAERPGINTYLLVFLFFALGLMSKPMLVTLPFVLLLLDYWPLGRLRLGQSGKDMVLETPATPVIRLVWEKVPFFALTVISSVLTVYAQQAGGAVASIEMLPLGIRTANALVSYVSYAGKMIWPHRLAVFYPHTGVPPVWQVVGACLLLLGVTVFVIRVARRFPYLPVGWLWYFGTLVPVIGLVQVGAQSMADRYTYVPLIGLFMIIAWGTADLAARWRYRRHVFVTLTGIVLLSIAICTWLQVHYWRNRGTLFQHAVDVTNSNYVAYNNLGRVMAKKGELEKAFEHYLSALQINPKLAEAHYSLAFVLAKQGRFEEAISYYSSGLQINADDADAHNNLASALVQQGRLQEALGHYSHAVRIKPDFAKAHYNMGILLKRMGNHQGELKAYERAIQLKPDYAKAYSNLGVVYAEMGFYSKAIWAFKEAVRLNPDDRVAQQNLRKAYERAKKVNSSIP